MPIASMGYLSWPKPVSRREEVRASLERKAVAFHGFLFFYRFLLRLWRVLCFYRCLSEFRLLGAREDRQ